MLGDIASGDRAKAQASLLPNYRLLLRKAMKKPIRLAVLLLAVAGARGPHVARAQAPQQVPSFPSEVELITVDAVVVDDKGQPVSGLTREDFQISEDGKPREIASFEAFEAEPELEPATPPGEAPVVATNESTRGSAAGRGFTILIDDVRLAVARSTPVRDAITAFIQREVRDGDEVTIGTTSGDVWWSARIPEGREDLVAVLARFEGRDQDLPWVDRMTEYEAYRIANFEAGPTMINSGTGSSVGVPGRASVEPHVPGLGGVQPRVSRRWAEANLCTPPACHNLVKARAIEIDARRRGRTRITLGAVRRALDALALVHGRKSLLLISDGFLQDQSSDLREVAAASRLANTAIYFLDPRGLAIPTGLADADRPSTFSAPDPQERAEVAFEQVNLSSAGTETLADDTGGFSVRNTNDLTTGMGRISDESRVFYLLGFSPPEDSPQREWRKLKVEVKRAGLTVRARRGYSLRTADATAKKEDKKPKDKGKKDKEPEKPTPVPAVIRTLDSAHEATGVPLRAMVYLLEPRAKETTHVLVAAELDTNRLTLVPEGKGRVGRVDLSVVATNRDTGRGFRHDETLTLPLASEETPGWRALVREFELPPGVTLAQVVVRDAVSGSVGSVSQRFEVPPSGILRLSTPIVSDRVEPAKEPNGRPQPAIAVHRVFRPQAGLYVQYEVFGAALPTGQSSPRVSAGLEVRTRDGRVVRKADASAIAPDGSGRVVRTMGLGTDGLEDGRYELVLLVRDEVRGTGLEQREPFTLSREASVR
jgi:VWFA-related protein